MVVSIPAGAAYLVAGLPGGRRAGRCGHRRDRFAAARPGASTRPARSRVACREARLGTRLSGQWRGKLSEAHRAGAGPARGDRASARRVAPTCGGPPHASQVARSRHRYGRAAREMGGLLRPRAGSLRAGRARGLDELAPAAAAVGRRTARAAEGMGRNPTKVSSEKIYKHSKRYFEHLPGIARSRRMSLEREMAGWPRRDGGGRSPSRPPSLTPGRAARRVCGAAPRRACGARRTGDSHRRWRVSRPLRPRANRSSTALGRRGIESVG